MENQTAEFARPKIDVGHSVPFVDIGSSTAKSAACMAGHAVLRPSGALRARASKLLAVCRQVAGDDPAKGHVQQVFDILNSLSMGVAEDAATYAERLSSELEAWQRGQRGAPAVSVTAAYLRWPDLTIAHVGDGRAYLRRDGRTLQMTRDDTLRQVLFERCIPVDDSQRGRGLTQAIGDPDSEIEVRSWRLRRGDEVLLCCGQVARLLDTQALSLGMQRSITSATVCRRVVERCRARANNEEQDFAMAMARVSS